MEELENKMAPYLRVGNLRRLLRWQVLVILGIGAYVTSLVLHTHVRPVVKPATPEPEPENFPPYFGPLYVLYECDGSMECGGWADRQKGIVAAYMLAQMTNRRLKIRIPFPCDLETKLLPNKMDWRVGPDEFANIRTHKIQLMNEPVSRVAMSLMDKDLDKHFTAPLIKLTINMEWTQYLRQNKRFASRSPLLFDQNIPISDLYKRALREVYTLTQPLKDQLEIFRQEVAGRKLACAHVRLGDPSIKAQNTTVFWNMKVEGLQHVWEFLQSYAVPGWAIFVPTDSPVIIEETYRRFPNNTIQIPGRVVHVDKSNSSATCEGLDKVIVDQEAMAFCDVIVVSRSGLGIIGSWLRPREDNNFCLVKNSTIIPCPRDDFRILYPDDTW